MSKDSLLDELNDLEGKKKPTKKEEPKAKLKKEEPKKEPKVEPKPKEEVDLNNPSLDVVLKIMDGDVESARKGIADLTTNAVKQFVNGKELGDKPVSFGDEEPKKDEPTDKETGSKTKDDE